MPKSENEEGQAESIAEESDQGDSDKFLTPRESRTESQPKRSIDGSGDEALGHGYLHRVSCRELPGEVIVHSPSQTGCHNRQRSPRHPGIWTAEP